MKTTSVVCAIVALITGLIAAWYWLSSTSQKINPAIHKMDNGKEAFRPMEWAKSVMDTAAEASRLNGWAAIWTAISVLASGLSALLSALS